MRRGPFVMSAAAALLSLVVAAPPASAAESISGGAWDGSTLYQGAHDVEVSGYVLRGQFNRFDRRAVEVTLWASPPGTGACAVSPVVANRGPTPLGFERSLAMPCNGTYTIAATAVTTDNRFLPRESATLDRVVTVSAPAPEVTGLTVEAGDAARSMVLAWDDMRRSAPDLSGYIVERQVDDGTYEPVAELGPDEDGYTDDELPDDAGHATYRVSSTRPTPGGEVTSQSTETPATRFAGVTAGDSGAAGSDSPDGALDGGSAAGETSTADGTADPQGGARQGAIRPGAAFSSSFPSALLRPSPRPGRSSSSTVTTVDGGFDEELHYDAEPGGSKPVLPDDAMASIFTGGEAAGRGMAVPLATALVLAMWAFHLRRLAAAARPTG